MSKRLPLLVALFGILCVSIFARADSYSAGSATVSGSVTVSSVTAAPGAATIVSGQVSVSTTGVLVAARTGRRSVIVKNTDTATTIYIGPSGVSSSTGMPLKAGESTSVNTSAVLHAVSASGTVTVAYVEEYD